MSSTVSTVVTSSPSTRDVSSSTVPAERASSSRVLAVLGGVSLALAPLLLTGGTLTSPPQDSDSSVDYVESLGRDPFLTHLSGGLYHYGWVLFAFGLLAAMALVRGRRGRVLTLIGGLGGAFGAIQISGMILGDWFNGASARTVPVEQAGAILDTVSASPSLQVWMMSGQVGALLLPVLLFLGLARAGVISWWIAPLSLLAFVGGPVAAGLVGGGVMGVAVTVVASLVCNLPVFVTAARLVTRGRTGTVTA